MGQRNEDHPGRSDRVAPLLFAAVARGLALFWGLVVGLDLVAQLRDRGFESTVWWVDLRSFPPGVVHLFLGVTGALLLAFAIRPNVPRIRKILTIFCLAVLTTATIADGTRFLLLLSSGTIRADCPIPLSFLIAGTLSLVLVGIESASRRTSTTPRPVFFFFFLCCLIGFPLAQIFCFGLTDYRRPADVAVVFGARAYADGRPSNALADRVRAACELYQQGLVPRLLFSGGAGDGAIHETEAMRLLAVGLGVPDKAILLDPCGITTEATVRDTVLIFRRERMIRVLAVSHFYHLPRIKMCYQAAGWEVYTVPASQARPLLKLPWLIAREVVAIWAYYLRAVVRSPA